jgi:MFS family permease
VPVDFLGILTTIGMRRKVMAAPKNSILKVLSLRDFRLLWIGSGLSLLGDQFVLIATPWLVLHLTNDPMSLGFVLALQGIPRAVFMLVGGAITDRFSPRAIMLLSDLARLCLTACMAVVIFSGGIQMWMIYLFSLAFGLVSGFAVPAANSIVPNLVPANDLQTGNAVNMGTAQLVGFIGPTLAGVIIAQYSGATFGIALAFAVDALGFAVSATCLWLMRGGGRRMPFDGTAGGGSVWGSIWSGIRYLWGGRNMRFMFFVLIAANLLFIGPLLVGIPVLAKQRLPEGAVAFGLLMSAYAGGNLTGYLLAGVLPKLKAWRMTVFVVGLLVAFGLVMSALGLVNITWVDSILMAVLGVGNGYMGIIVFTWIQQRTPREMLGRMMGMFMFAQMGLTPVSQALAGVISKWSLTGLFLGSGALILVLAVWCGFQPELSALGEDVLGESSSAQA